MIAAAGDTLVMDYFGEGLHQHPIAEVSHRHRQIGVFVVSRGVAVVKATNAAKQLRTHQ